MTPQENLNFISQEMINVLDVAEKTNDKELREKINALIIEPDGYLKICFLVIRKLQQ
jgi:hypothetical protein